MNTSTKEEQFFHEISLKTLNLVRIGLGETTIIRQKGLTPLNYATKIDIDVETTIVKEIKKRFPTDLILSEENYSAQTITKERIWIIDPICGSYNLARGLKTVVTNIALAKNKKLIAACAIDHNRNEYIWTVGRGIFIGKSKLIIPKKPIGILIDIDLGALKKGNRSLSEKYSKFLTKLILETNYGLVSFDTSLNFAYVATGRIDAYISPKNYVWDVAAANFLILQAGGAVTELSGKPWTLNSTNVVAARNKKLHQQVLNLMH